MRRSKASIETGETGQARRFCHVRFRVGYHQVQTSPGDVFMTPRRPGVSKDVVRAHRFRPGPVKAASNAARHGVTFEAATTVFRDPLGV